MDLAEFVSDYVSAMRENGNVLPPRKELAKEISEAYGEYVPDITAEMDDTAYMKWAHDTIAPQVEYYLN